MPPLLVRLRSLLSQIDFHAVAVWLLGFGLVVYLALKGGGYQPTVRNQLGIAVWWGVLLGVVVGALPLNRLRRGSWIALGLLGAYVGWVALSCIWTHSTESTVEDLGRVVTYLGVFALALSLRSSKGARRMVTAVGSGIAVVAIVALLSRLHPAWFPGAAETVASLPKYRSRLAYPLGYWNGLASLVAIGLPLVLYVATSARTILARAIAAAALPAMALTIYFTFSRGGTLAAIVAIAVFVALAHDRVEKTATLLIAGLGSLLLILGAHQRHLLDAGLGSEAAHHQGNSLLAMAMVVCVGVGLLQAALAIGLRHGRRPAWTRPSRRTSLIGATVTAVVIVVVAIAAGAPHQISHGWHEFKGAKAISNGSSRFDSFSSNGRWPLWQAALEENASAPLIGTGSGSFEQWWARHRGDNGFVRDAHSLYFQTLGELGIVGLALLVAFLGWVLLAGTRRYVAASQRRRTQLAAILAGCAAFCLGAAYDWLWQIAVIPIAFLLLASVLVSAGERSRRRTTPIWLRAGGGVLAISAMVAIAIPLAASTAISQSQAAVRQADIPMALELARQANAVEPFAAQPHVQEALILESQGNLALAAVAAARATEREPHEWRAWVIRSRIDAERGDAKGSLAAYRRAKNLNPDSVLFME
jgi:hypothetical protein